MVRPGGHVAARRAQARNLDSDVFWGQTSTRASSSAWWPASRRVGQSAAARSSCAGYVAGYNAYLRRVGGSRGVPDPTCRGKGWVRPITTGTAYRRLYQLAMVDSSNEA